MKPVISFLIAILFNTLAGVALAPVLGVDPLYTVIGSNALSLIPRGATGLMAGLNKEIWVAEIMEKFYPNWSFLKEARNMDEFVEYNTINLAEAGVDPDVLVNNDSYPIAFAARADVPLTLSLDTYDTENTVVRNVEEIESAYNKMQSVLSGHKNALLNFFSRKAAHAYSPASDSANTPVLATTGAANGGFKRMKLEDIIALSAKFDALDAPEGSRVLVLNPSHLHDLMTQELDLFKGFVQNSQGFELFGFKVYKFSKTPLYNKTTGEKKAFGAVAAPSTDTISSFAFVNSEVMRAQGTVDMFPRIKDPEERGDIIGFQMRALAMPMRNKYIASVYSDDA